jgi:hypothetical protein
MERPPRRQVASPVWETLHPTSCSPVHWLSMLDQPFVSGLPGHHKGAARPLNVPPICAEVPVCRKLNRENVWLLLADQRHQLVAPYRPLPIGKVYLPRPELPSASARPIADLGHRKLAA